MSSQEQAPEYTKSLHSKVDARLKPLQHYLFSNFVKSDLYQKKKSTDDLMKLFGEYLNQHAEVGKNDMMQAVREYASILGKSLDTLTVADFDLVSFDPTRGRNLGRTIQQRTLSTKTQAAVVHSVIGSIDTSVLSANAPADFKRFLTAQGLRGVPGFDDIQSLSEYLGSRTSLSYTRYISLFAQRIHEQLHKSSLSDENKAALVNSIAPPIVQGSALRKSLGELGFELTDQRFQDLLKKGKYYTDTGSLDIQSIQQLTSDVALCMHRTIEDAKHDIVDQLDTMDRIQSETMSGINLTTAHVHTISRNDFEYGYLAKYPQSSPKQRKQAYQEFLKNTKDTYLHGIETADHDHHTQMVKLQKSSPNDPKIHQYISHCLHKSLSTVIEYGKAYGADLESVGGEAQYTQLMQGLLDPMISELDVPGGHLVFTSKDIQLIDPSSGEDPASRLRKLNALHIDRDRSVIPGYMRKILGLPVQDPDTNPLGVSVVGDEGYLTKTDSQGATLWYGLKNISGVISYQRSPTKEGVSPITLGLYKGRDISGNTIQEYQLDIPSQVDSKDIPDPESREFEAINSQKIRFEHSNLTVSVGEKLLFGKSLGNIQDGAGLTMVQMILLRQSNPGLEDHLQAGLELLRTTQQYKNSNTAQQRLLEQECIKQIQQSRPLAHAYGDALSRETGLPAKRSLDRRYQDYGTTRFVDLTNSHDQLPSQLCDHHSDTAPIPGWIDNGIFYANTQYFSQYLQSQLPDGYKNSLLIDREAGNVHSTQLGIDEKTSQLFDQLFNTTVNTLNGKQQLHPQFPTFTFKGIGTLRRQYDRLKRENPYQLTSSLEAYIQVLLTGFESTRKRFEQWKSHESMHRLIMTQSTEYTDAVSASTQKRIDYDEILDVGIDADDGRPLISHELLCMIAEGRPVECLEISKITDAQCDHAKQYTNNIVLLQADLDPIGGQVVLYDITTEKSYTISISELNSRLGSFFGNKLTYDKSGEKLSMSFGGTPLDENQEGESTFDIRYVRQYSLRQAMQGDSVLHTPVAADTGIDPERILPLDEQLGPQDLIHNPEDIYVQSTQQGQTHPLDGQPNFVTFETRDADGRPYTGDSLTRDVKQSLGESAERLGRQARESEGNIHIPQDSDGRYIVDEDLPNDLQDYIDEQIQTALGPIPTDTSGANRQTPERRDDEHDDSSQSMESQESPREQFEKKFEEVFHGDKLAIPANGTVIMTRMVISKLQGGGSLRARGEIIDANDSGFRISIDSTTEVPYGPHVYPSDGTKIGSVQDLEKLEDTFKELYKFRPIDSYGKLSEVQGGHFEDKAGKNTLKNGLEKFDDLTQSGNGFTKEFYDSKTNKKSTNEVTHRGNLNKRNGGDNVLFSVQGTGNKVRVQAAGVDKDSAKHQYGMDHTMDIPSFILFIADKGLEPYCEEEISREAVKYPNRGDQGDEIEAKGFWDSFVSISAAIAAVKKFPEAYKYRREQQEKFEASLFAKQLASVVPDSMTALYANEIKNDLISEHDDTTFSVINGYKDKISQKDGAGGTHDKVIASIIEKEVFKNPSDSIRAKHKAAGYLLYAMEKGNPYIRSLQPYSDEGMRTRVLLGEKKQKQFQEEKKKFYARLQTRGATDDEYDKLVKFEIKFISDHLTDHPLFGPKYGRTLENLHDNYSNIDKVDKVKSGVEGKGNFLDMYNAFNGGGMSGLKPSTMMGALEAMEGYVEDDVQYNIFYKALMQMLLSGVVSYEFDNTMKDRLRGICRKRGIPIGMMCKQIGHPENIMNIVNYIAAKAGKPPMDTSLQDHIKSLTPSSFTSQIEDGGKMKPKYKVISSKVAKRREANQQGQTVIDAFNYKNSALVEGLAEEQPEIERYFSTGAVFNPVKDYRENAASDGTSPFYDGILNLAPGTFQSQLIDTIGQRGQFGKNSRTANELWEKFNGGIETFKDLIDGSASNPKATEKYIEFIWKKFRAYFGDKIGEEYFSLLHDAIHEGDKEYFERLIFERLLDFRYSVNKRTSRGSLTGKDLKGDQLSGGDFVGLVSEGVREPIYQKGIKTYKELLRNAFSSLDSVTTTRIFNTFPYG